MTGNLVYCSHGDRGDGTLRREVCLVLKGHYTVPVGVI